VTSLAAPYYEGRTREDSEAERLFAEYSDRILAYCLGRLRSRPEAEDAVQLTFLYALRALRRGVVPQSESAWLHTIAKNVCLCQLRTTSRRPVTAEHDLESVAGPDVDDDPELLAGLRDALQSLPERQRHALLLREWRGLSAQEIADELELSGPATHALLTRARHALAQALTAPRRAAAGLASMVYELRSSIKAALGGASAKVAVATIALVGVGVGSVAVDQSLGKEGSTPPAESSARAVEVTSAAGRTTPGGTTAATRTAASRQAGRDASSGLLTAALDREGRAFASPPKPSEPVSPADRAPGPAAPPASAAPESEAQVTVPLALPAPPDIGLPPVDLPPVDLPPVDLPPVDLPPVDLPPVDLPTDGLPPVDLPSTDLLPADVPPAEIADLLPADVPPVPPTP
jgi:RNA polymerase sigma factor (sigma-70 family)